MGYATSWAPCGCITTRLMEPTEDVFIEWVRCAKHYKPEVDDIKIVEAAKNKRVHEKEIWNEVNKV